MFFSQKSASKGVAKEENPEGKWAISLISPKTSIVFPKFSRVLQKISFVFPEISRISQEVFL